MLLLRSTENVKLKAIKQTAFSFYTKSNLALGCARFESHFRKTRAEMETTEAGRYKASFRQIQI